MKKAKRYIIEKNNNMYYITQDELCNNGIWYDIVTFDDKVIDEFSVNSHRKDVIEKELNKIGYKLIGELY